MFSVVPQARPLGMGVAVVEPSRFQRRSKMFTNMRTREPWARRLVWGRTVVLLFGAILGCAGDPSDEDGHVEGANSVAQSLYGGTVVPVDELEAVGRLR